MAEVAVRHLNFFLLWSLCLSIQAENIGSQNGYRLTKDCKVFYYASPYAKVMCEAKEGTAVSKIGAVYNAYHYVQLETGCMRYLSRVCLPSKKATKRNSVPRRLPRRTKKIPSKVIQPIMGFRASVDPSLSGSVSYSTTKSTGLGWAVGLLGGLEIQELFRFLVGASYQSLSLTRTITSSSSALSFAGSIEYTQSLRFLGIGGLAGVEITHLWKKDNNFRGAGWLEVGAEYLLPLSATQTDNLQGQADIAKTARPFLLLVGATGTFHLTPQFHLGLSGCYFFNLASNSSSKLTGFRVGVAFLTPL